MINNRQELTKIAWTEAYSVGNHALDAQHKNLIAMINELAECHRTLGTSSPPEALARILGGLFDYTCDHFDAEDAYMGSIGYPLRLAHREEHSKFIETMAFFNLDSLSGLVDFPDVHRFLVDWLFEHIMTSDMQYRLHAETMAQRAAPRQP